MKSPRPPIDPSIPGIAQALGRVEGAVDAIKDSLVPLAARVEAHEKAINQSKGALAILGVLWAALVAALGLVFGFWRR